MLRTDDPPGFRVAADGSVRSGSSSDLNPAFFGFDSHADYAPPTGNSDAASRLVNDGGNPFGALRAPNATPIPSFDGGSLPPYVTSLLFPQMAEPLLSWPGLQDGGGELDAGPDGPLAGFRVESPADDPPGFRVGGSVQQALLDDSGHPQGPTTYDPTDLSALLRDPVQEALDQIAAIYAGVGANRLNRIDGQGPDIGPVTLRGGGVGGGALAAVGDAFDPRYIVQTGGPVGPRPGPGHNGGPPLRDSASPIPTQPSRGGQVQGAPPAPQPPDNSAAVAGAAAAAAATEQPNEPVPVDPEADEKLEAWQKIVKARGEQAPDSQYLGAGGVNTLVGVRLNPKLPEPKAGWQYLPALRHLRNGYRGELELANRIMAAPAERGCGALRHAGGASRARCDFDQPERYNVSVGFKMAERTTIDWS
jgi:hypothetical protein